MVLYMFTCACQSNQNKAPMTVRFNIGNAPDYRIQLIVTNTTPVDKIIDTFSWQIPSLVLEIIDTIGNQILPLPPPVPDEAILEKSKKILKPGESITLHIEGLGDFPDLLGNQIYRIRCKGFLQNPSDKKYEQVYSEWKNLKYKSSQKE